MSKEDISMIVDSVDKPIVVLSDFDDTLCDATEFDPSSNNHLPVIDPEVSELVKAVPTVIATARRFGHPAFKTIRSMVSMWTPVIAENGGVTLMPPMGGREVNINNEAEIEEVHSWAAWAMSMVTDVPKGQELALKRGETLNIIRFQSEDGRSLPMHQDILRDQLLVLERPSTVSIDHTGGGLTIQHEAASKAAAFRRFLGRINVTRSSVFVVGIGNAANDKAIFDEADLSVGVDKRVADLVDIPLAQGVESTKQVLQQLVSRELFDLAGVSKRVWDDDFARRDRAHRARAPRHWRDAMYS